MLGLFLEWSAEASDGLELELYERLAQLDNEATEGRDEAAEWLDHGRRRAAVPSESQDKARKIAGAIHWIDLERQVLRTILLSRVPKDLGCWMGSARLSWTARRMALAP
ncbi:hypothetical protein V2G26_000375 [Clonostachys chloroleuca]